MKKTNLVFLVAAVSFFSACNFQLPEKISVKTNAEYKFNVGKVNTSFEESINKQNIINGENLGVPNSRVYDYFPSEKNLNVQQYLLRLPLMEIPVDIGEYYKNSGISTAVQGMSFDQEIEIPIISINTKKLLDTTEISESLNKMFSFTGIAGDGNASFLGDFDTVTYSRGTMIITVAGSIPDGATVSLDGRTGIFSNNQAEINIDNYTLKKGQVSVNFSDGRGLQFTGTIKSGSKIDVATGVVYSDLDIPVTAKFNIPNKFISAVVNEGTLITSTDIPWSKTSISYNIQTSGAMSVSGTGDINLAGVTMKPGEVGLNTTIKASFHGSTIRFDKNPSVSVSTDIKSFREVVINAADIKTSLTQEEEFTEDVRTSIKEMMLIPSGLKGKYTNTLPEGNNITITANSDFFGISNGASVLSSGQTDSEMPPIMSPAGFRKSIVPVSKAMHSPATGKYSGWDFAMNIKFQGDDGNPNHINVKNVKPGEKYKIGMEFEPELNWEYVKIEPPNSNNAEVKSLGINFAQLFSSMGDTLGSDFSSKITISSVPIYIRAERPSIGNLFDNYMFKGKINLFYAKDNGGTPLKLQKNGRDIEKNILQNGSSMRFVESIPEYKIKNSALITDIGKYDASIKDNLSGIINDSLDLSEGELYIDYDIMLTGAGGAITITKDQCENSSSSSIAVVALIDIPLKFKVISDTEPVVLDVGSFMGTDSSVDLFGRTSKTPVSQFENFSGVIESCGFRYETKKTPFYSDPEMELEIEVMPGETKKHLVKQGETLVSRSGIEKMFSEESYPYAPKMKLNIPPLAEFSLPRELVMEMKVTLVINTDGTIDLFGGSD